jgi:hypothetical protein
MCKKEFWQKWRIEWDIWAHCPQQWAQQWAQVHGVTKKGRWYHGKSRIVKKYLMTEIQISKNNLIRLGNGNQLNLSYFAQLSLNSVNLCWHTMLRQVKYPELSQFSPKAKDAMYKRKWREEQKSDPTKKESSRKQQNEYKRRSRAKLKLQQTNVEPSVKCRQVATPDAGPSDYHALASNLPTVMSGPSHDTPSTFGSSSLPTYTTISSPSGINRTLV